MKAWMEKMMWKFYRFMQGRNGMDKLSSHLWWTAFVVSIITLFVPNIWMSLLTTFCILFSVFRIFSKNIPKRRRELMRYERMIAKPQGFVKLQKNRYRDRKTHKYYKYGCGAVLRVPKGRGEIIITCPKCHNKLEKRT